MPPLPTYTASGQLRGGPVAAGVPAQTQSAEALSRVSGSLFAASQDAQQISAIVEQRKREDDFKWKSDASITFKSRMIAWQNAPENQGREDIGSAYRAEADKAMEEVMSAAPTKQAADLFRRDVAPGVLADWDSNLRRETAIRFDNFRNAQVEGATLENAEYQKRAATDPVKAGQVLSSEMTQRIASIEMAYGRSMPAQAALMKEQAVVNAVNGTMDTDPQLARQLLDKHSVVDPETRRVMLNRIEQVEKSALDTATYNEISAIENSIAVGYDRLTPVAPINPALLKTLPKNTAQRLVQEVEVANSTISKFSEVKAWNWQEQQKAISAIDISKGPVEQKTRENLVKLVAKSQQQQTENPAGWQLANDPEFQGMNARLAALPPEARTPARMVELNRMVALQGAPPEGTSPEQAKRYLNLPTGLQNVMSVEEAKSRAATLNNVPPNQLTAKVTEFESEFPDERLAAMAWNDMQNLPEGEGKLRMGVRVATAINDLQVRNHFLGAMSNEAVLKAEDTPAAFKDGLDGNTTFRRFVSGWIGDGGQRSGELKEFRDSILRYATFISAQEKLSATQALDKSVKRLISDNYAIITVNGSDLPIYKFDQKGRPRFPETDYRYIESGLSNALQNIDPRSLSVEKTNFPSAPFLPGSDEEQNRYLKSLIQSSGTVVIEPDGKSATVYIRGQGEDDFPFQLRGADGMPMTWQLESLIARGKAITDKKLEESIERNKIFYYQP